MTGQVRPWRVSETGRVLASTSTYRGAQTAVARRIGADVTGRVLVITGPDGFVCHATNAGLTIDYQTTTTEGTTTP